MILITFFYNRNLIIYIIFICMHMYIITVAICFEAKVVVVTDMLGYRVIVVVVFDEESYRLLVLNMDKAKRESARKSSL